MDGFWNAVEEKEVVKKKPKVEVMMPRILVVGRGSRFLKRQRQGKRERERILRYFSRGETLKSGYCYKTRV